MMNSGLYLPPPKSADEKVKDIFLDLRNKSFEGMDTFSTLGWVEAKYVPGQMTITLDQFDYGTNQPNKSVLEFILDNNYTLEDVAQTVGGQHIYWTEEQMKREEWLVAECLLHDPRYVLYHRQNVKEIQSGQYSLDIGGPVKRLADSVGVSLYANITIWGGMLQEINLMSKTPHRETMMGKIFFYYP